MRVRMTSAVVGEDGQDWYPGEIREASAHFGRGLIQRGKAEPATEEVENRDPAPKKRKK